jgi:hypothetical protein
VGQQLKRQGPLYIKGAKSSVRVEPWIGVSFSHLSHLRHGHLLRGSNVTSTTKREWSVGGRVHPNMGAAESLDVNEPGGGARLSVAGSERFSWRAFGDSACPVSPDQLKLVHHTRMQTFPPAHNNANASLVEFTLVSNSLV